MNFGQSQDAKKGTLYELGSKWELFDERLFVSGALFQITQSNMQATEDSDPATNNGKETRTSCWRTSSVIPVQNCRLLVT